MTKSTSRALRATAAVAGMAALGATFAGAAAAATPSAQDEASDVQGTEAPSEAPSPSDAGAPTAVKDMLDRDGSQPGLHEPGLATFEMPRMKSSSASPVPDSDDSDHYHFQHPKQEKGNDYGKGDFQIAGLPLAAPDGLSTHANNPEVAQRDEGNEASQSGDTPATSMMDRSSMEDSITGGGNGLSGHRITAPV